ncbi:MAG: glycerol kinase GlpK [Burkholderiaceae bacterium]|nr:MAG: glycerol kinase GlpK [Burkholderiaceae bacterium]
MSQAPRYILALDQGTSSSRAMLFDERSQPVAMAQVPLDTRYPEPGWVEQDAQDIWRGVEHCMRTVIAQAGIQPSQVAAIGLTNQRETTVLWHRQTGQALHPALVWQDRRTQDECEKLRQQHGEDWLHQRTGLRWDPYFSGTKLAWLLSHVPGALALAQQGLLAFGTVDSWLVWQLTQGQVHATDPSNASRTLLWNLRDHAWDPALLQALDIPASLLPEVRPSAGHFGVCTLLGHPIPITGVAGDQQAALMGQGCWRPGLAKNTYGTGCFALLHTGAHAVSPGEGLLATACASGSPFEADSFAIEGSVFMGGAIVQWLRDGLLAGRSSAEVAALADSVPDSGGVTLVPAFAGLGAPHWRPDVRAAILGLSRGSTLAHIARAGIEAMALQSFDLIDAMNRSAVARGNTPLRELRVDGGAAVNDTLMQWQADLLGIPVLRPRITETTALGAAWLAGLGVGLWADLQQLEPLWQLERRFDPQRSRSWAQETLARWHHAVAQVCA